MTEPALLAACALARRFEGCSLHPYRDPVGIPTIGYGATHLLDGSRVTMDTPPLTQSQADDMLEAEMQIAAGQVDEMVSVAVTDGEAAALYDFAFNLGVTALSESTLLRLLNKGFREAAAMQFGRWVHAGGRILPGLVRRRAAEEELFVKGLPDA